MEFRLNELHLFAGAGGGILGGILLGHRCVCAVEINEYRRAVLLQRQRDGALPWFPIWDNVKTFNGTEWRGRVDAVCGGFPCQRFSSATRGRATAEDLWPEMLRVVVESEPTYVFAENVSRSAIEIAAEDLGELGYASKAVSISAKDLGADHIRRRCWLFAHTNHKGELRRKKYAKVERVPDFQPSIWETYPNKSGMVDGLANRMERFEAIGNGQIPLMAATTWRTLNQPPTPQLSQPTIL
jgi:DNA (cytosine-5)-methyltransferase 1